MQTILTAGDGFIWITSVAGGIILVSSIYHWIGRRRLRPQDRALIGEWFGYAHFSARPVDLFYKERVTIELALFPPGRLKVTAKPVADDSDTVYRGVLKVAAPFFYCTTDEPIYGDRTYAVGRRVMDHRHDAGTIAWLSLGTGYDDNVRCATATIWTRRELDPNSTPTKLADPAIERSRFLELANEYFRIDPETLQLKLI